MKSSGIHAFNIEEGTSSFYNRNMGLRRQILYNVSPILGAICHGITSRFTKGLLPNIFETSSSNRDLLIAEAVTDLAIPLGAIACVFLMRYRGRKLSLRLSCIPWLLGSFCMFLTPDKWLILAGFLLLWFSTTLNNAASIVYTFEICEPRIRTLMIVILSFAYHSGIFLFDIFRRDHHSALLMIHLFLANAFILTFFCPETPNYLIQNGMALKAKKVFFWIRGTSVEEGEFNVLLSTVTEGVQNEKIWPKLLSKRFCKIFVILSAMFLVHIAPPMKILKNDMISPVDVLFKSNQWLSPAIVTDLIALSASVCTCFLVTKTSRRSLFLFSATGVFLASTILCIMVRYELPQSVELFFMLAGTWFMYMGVEQIPWIVAMEIYPDNLRDVGIGLGMVYVFLLHQSMWKLNSFVTLKYHPWMTLGVQAVTVFVGLIISYFVMPETKNISLQEINSKMPSS